MAPTASVAGLTYEIKVSLYDSISETNYNMNIIVNPLAPEFITSPPPSLTVVQGVNNKYLWP